MGPFLLFIYILRPNILIFLLRFVIYLAIWRAVILGLWSCKFVPPEMPVPQEMFVSAKVSMFNFLLHLWNIWNQIVDYTETFTTHIPQHRGLLPRISLLVQVLFFSSSPSFCQFLYRVAVDSRNPSLQPSGLWGWWGFIGQRLKNRSGIGMKEFP